MLLGEAMLPGHGQLTRVRELCRLASAISELEALQRAEAAERAGDRAELRRRLAAMRERLAAPEPVTGARERQRGRR
jgi:hypothetical protein